MFNFSAFTDYETTLSATSSTKAVVLQNLRNYLYKTIKIAPSTTGKYTKISKFILIVIIGRTSELRSQKIVFTIEYQFRDIDKRLSK